MVGETMEEKGEWAFAKYCAVRGKGVAEGLLRRAAAHAEKYAALHETHPDDFFLKAVSGRMETLFSTPLHTIPIDTSFRLLSGVSGESAEAVPHDISTFCEQCKELELSKAIPSDFQPDPLPVSLPKGSSPKKHHEVDQLRKLVEVLVRGTDPVVVNVGEGKGHLSEAVAKSCDVPCVVGIDCNAHLTECSRQRRVEKMVPITLDITPDMSPIQWSAAIRDGGAKVSDDLREAVLLGLHCCGDLGSSVVQVFAESRASSLAMVPCCFHALSQKGYPLTPASPPLTSVSRALGTTAVASWGEETYLGHFRIKYYRAVLALLMGEAPRITPSALRRAAKLTDTSLAAFLRCVGSRAAEECDLAPHELDSPTGEAAFRAYTAFAVLRHILAPTLETILLLDRFLYLEHKGLPTALIPLFDPSLSPRSVLLLSQRVPSQRV
eukprot:Sspe_Gene.98316::Locus_71750_Transcript_1_1_Confidence_1.000_Length_1349::g.98316::m.98316